MHSFCPISACGSWHTPTGKQLDRLRIAVTKIVRKILGHHYHNSNFTAAEILVKAGVHEPRVRLALDRLLYAQRLFHHGPVFLQMMVHAEAAVHPDSWLHGLRQDLQWLYGVEAQPDPALLDLDHTVLIEQWQSGGRQWKGRVRRAGKRHLFQEDMMLEAHA